MEKCAKMKALSEGCPQLSSPKLKRRNGAAFREENEHVT